MDVNGLIGRSHRERAKSHAPGLTLQVNSYDLHDDQELLPSVDVNCITLMTTGAHGANIGRPTDGFSQRKPISWGRLGFVTAGMPASFKTGTCRLQACHLMFTNPTVERLVEEPVTWAFDDLPGYLDIGDRTLLSSMRRLRNEALSPGAAHGRMIEALGSAIIIDLYRRFAGQTSGASRRASRLAGWQSRRITDYVQAHVADGPVPITKLAAICGISAGHLSRAYKGTTGITLPGYVETVRMERACALLLGAGGMTLAEVARACGYAHSSNFATTFRRVFGETPSGFRRRGRSDPG